MFDLEELLEENPIIAAIRNDNDLRTVVKSKAAIVFVLYGNIMTIGDIARTLTENSKQVFIHVDFIEGLRSDYAGIEFIKTYANPYGIISTKSSNIKYAKQLGLCVIQRIFVIDSLSLKTGIKNINETCPNAIEVMPGIANKIIDNIKSQISIPIIAGGLISTKKDIIDSLSAGAISISTTNPTLWDET